MVNNVYFKYKEHPGDLFRSIDLIELPNADDDLENFLLQFLKHYQSDQRISYLNDLYKLADDEFYNEARRREFLNNLDNKSNLEIKNEILLLENELKCEAFENFYNLVLTKQIDLLCLDKNLHF